jgi:salicylate hydroxylase
MMIERIPKGIANFDKRLTSYETFAEGESDAAVKLHFADGTSYEADVLIAADGIKSVIRPTLLAGQVDAKDLKPKFTRTVSLSSK